MRVKDFRKRERLLIDKHVHLNRLDWFGFSMDDASNSLGGVTAKHRFSAIEANRRGNLLNPNELAVDRKHLTDQFLTALSFPAYMTTKHSYLRLA
jgi:hypothetical protein